MPASTLPKLRSVRRSTAVFVTAGLLSAGTTATAITAALQSHHGPHHAAGPIVRAVVTPSRAPIATPATSAAADTRPLSTKPKKLISATVLVTGRNTLSHHQLHALSKVSGVRRTQTVNAGKAKIDGHRAFVVGVNPQTFRPWTPKLTADSNALWKSVSSGELTASFDMGHNAKLPLGSTVPVAGSRSVTPIRIGAFATVGIAGVDAVVSSDRAGQIGLKPHSGVLISAPKASPLAVKRAALRIVGKHAHAELLRRVVITRDAGEFLTRTQITNFLHAAASRVGAPYVWGATGPDAFDCSGLVQWSFARAGIRMPRVAQEQFLTGPHVPYADARPGDLLFYHFDPTDPGDIDHVAIYVGDGEMLQAPHTGAFVELVPVLRAHLAAVVRVDPTLASQVA
ncbi:MAG TPA: C40 family peptidase [Mycobacteriales bacterium]|jgi:cell wall-associated NlpC family hydrolase|nr:C40 family peptidase [Mycobacteriales bacterium]